MLLVKGHAVELYDANHRQNRFRHPTSQLFCKFGAIFVFVGTAATWCGLDSSDRGVRKASGGERC